MTSDPVPLVALERVSVAHLDADQPTVRDVSFAIGRGEAVLLLGPSGAGKSTLTLALSGLIPHSLDAEVTGVVRVAGCDVASSSPAALSARIGMVFQDPDAQVVTATVLDEVAFALENLLAPADEIERRAERSLRRLGLWERRHDDPATLSGGGRQRLALAAALATDAPLLVLDEPTANLDPDGAREVYAALHKLVAAGDRSILLIEHDVDAALPLATRVLVLDDEGRLAFDGSPARVLGEHRRELAALGVWLPRSASHASEGMRDARPEADAGETASARVEDHAARRPAAAVREAPGGTRARASRGGAAASADAIVAVHDLVLARGRRGSRRTVLRGVSLDIPRGSFTAVVGPNGAGKTTLAQAIAGVLPAPRGSVRVDGDDPARSRRGRRVGFVFQNPEHQFVAHTVRDELAHDLRGRGLTRDEIDGRVDAMLGRLGLAAHAERHPFRLSGGQKRRLSVGTALIGIEPGERRVLVLDEPLFGQDRARASEIIGMLEALRADGVTIIVVTHDPALVDRCATHVVEVRDGRAVMRAHRPAEADPDPGERTLGPTEVSAAPVVLDDSSAVPLPDTGPVRVAAPPPAERRRALDRRDPLAKLVAVLPAMIALVFTRDPVVPAIVLSLSYAVLLAGSRLTRRLALWLGLVLPAIAAILSVGFSLWTDVETGIATGLRLAALLATALVGGVSTDGAGFVRSLTQHLRLPYRLGGTALAALRFVPRFRDEREIIRSAHRVRGRRGPLAAIGVGASTLVPLLASGIRHAERVALAMDARAFGAHPTRTERHPAVWTPADTALVIGGWLLTVAAFVGAALLPPG
ncbi:ATP-binding cassette domain-containing protein [Microbacterium sp. gxy059]|uniref:ATP-binding cassette domain-containing protein n=1 Tax=Microbacterium sp. gxy059 TaxID=2957199 RepID=UPI003D972439